MNAKQIFKYMYGRARSTIYVNQAFALANNREADQPTAYQVADRALHRVIDRGASIDLAIDVSNAVLWAVHWRFPNPKDASARTNKWLSDRHYNLVMSPEESRIWFEHPGIPGVTRDLGQTRNSELFQ